MSHEAASLDVLGALLVQPPSPEAWAALCAQLDRWPWSAAFCNEVLPWVDQALAAWPDPLRVAPQRWWEPVMLGNDALLLYLCRKLNLRRIYLANPRTVPWLVASPFILNLTIFDATQSQVDDAAARAIAECARLGKLRILLLGDNKIGASGFSALAMSARLKALEVLNASHNALHDDALDVLRLPQTFPALRRLDLSFNWLGDDAVEPLVESGLLDRLDALDLRGNVLSATATARLRALTAGSSIELTLDDQPHLKATTSTLPAHEPDRIASAFELRRRLAPREEDS